MFETIVRQRDEGQATWFLNGLMLTKASEAETGGAYCMMEHRITAASNPPPHIHNNEEEAFYVLEGEMEVEVGGEVATLTAGGFALGAPWSAALVPRLVGRGARARHHVRTGRQHERRDASLLRDRRRAGVDAHDPRAPGSRSRGAHRGRSRARHRHPPPAGAVKLLLTVAHPDDETFGCGSVIAHAAANGIDVVVACATRGELGEMADPDAGNPSPAQVGEIREAELRAAATLLGAAQVELLGWLDSGTTGDAAPGSLVAADPRVVEQAIAGVIEREQPDVVVTLDASDGHRDHAVVRDATLAAVKRVDPKPERVYLFCLPRSLLADFAGVPGLGTPDDEITTVVDVREHLDLRWKAIRTHASQSPPYDAMSPEVARAFLATDRFLRIEPPWTGGDLESDWIPR